MREMPLGRDQPVAILGEARRRTVLVDVRAFVRGRRNSIEFLASRDKHAIGPLWSLRISLAKVMATVEATSHRAWSQKCEVAVSIAVLT